MKNNEYMKHKSEEIVVNGKSHREEGSRETREIKNIRILGYAFLVIMAFIALLLSTSVQAQEETIDLEATYPRVEDTADGAIFKFPVSLIYRGDHARQFDLRTSGPSDWDIYVTSSDESIRISIIKLEPNKDSPEQVKIIASPPPSVIPVAGDYNITLVASSGDIMDSIKLTAVIIPTYSLELAPSPSYYRKVTAKRDNFFSLIATNTGSHDLTNIRFSADEPQGWIIQLKPEIIDRLAPNISHEVQVNVQPASKTDDWYHEVTLVAEADQVRQTTLMNFRVEEPKGFWMWIVGAIAFVVIGAFTFIFLRLSRSK